MGIATPKYRFTAPWLLLTIAMAASACGKWTQEAPADPGLAPWDFPGPALSAKRGVGWWPTNQRYERCFAKLGEGAELMFLHRQAFAERDAAIEAQDQWIEFADEAGLEKYLAIEPFSERGRRTVRAPKGWDGEAAWANPAWVELYREHLLELTRKHRPEYLCIAVEANMYYSHEPEDYEAFRRAFPALRTAIKGVSPETAVFATYQYEVLTGRAGFWVTREPQLELLGERALEQDLLGVSSYPLFLERPYDAAALPDDYYAPLGEHSDLPVFFGELGWYSSPDVSPASSQAGQARFIRRLRTLLTGFELEALCWINLLDMPPTKQNRAALSHAPQFLSLALLDAELTPKMAWDEWQRLPEAMEPAEGGGASYAPPPLAPLALDENEIDFASFRGLGSTRAAESEPRQDGEDGQPPLRWSYAFEKKPMSMLLCQSPPPLGADFAGLRFSLYSERPTTLVVLLNERGGAQYEQRLEIEGGEWITIDAPRDAFRVQPTTPDDNDRLDPDQVVAIPLIDFSGHLGKSGTNEILLRRIEVR